MYRRLLSKLEFDNIADNLVSFPMGFAFWLDFLYAAFVTRTSCLQCLLCP